MGIHHDDVCRSDALELRGLIQGRTVIVGVGNLLRGDDGLGPVLIARLQGRCPALCIDAGPVPENYVKPVVCATPETVVLVYAVDLGLPPGSWTVLGRDNLCETGLTTHSASLGTLMDFLHCRTRAQVHVIAVQPENLELGAELSPAVRQTVEVLASLLEASTQPPA